MGFVSIGIPIIPMGLAANSVGFPDVMFAVFAAWVIRRPVSAPIVGIVFFGVLADALMMRPLGLWALVLFVGMELLRLSERAFRDIPFLLEWLYVSGLFALMLMLQNVLLFVSFDSVYMLSDVIWHWVRTVVSYPFVVLILHWVLRIRAYKKDNRPNRLGYVL
jgi:rod shape-determining protein MreD